MTAHASDVRCCGDGERVGRADYQAFPGVGGHGGMLTNGKLVWKPVPEGDVGRREVDFYEAVVQRRRSSAKDDVWTQFLPP